MGGPGSQRNKQHKPGRRAGRSAREKHRDKKDASHRQGIKASSHSLQGKTDRINSAKQVRDRKRAELLEARRVPAAPRLVAILPLSKEVNVQLVWNNLLQACANSTDSTPKNCNGQEDMDYEINRPSDSASNDPLVPTTVCFSDRRQMKVTLLAPPLDRQNPLEIVEVARVAEVVMFVVSGHHAAETIDAEGRAALAVLRGMGPPSPVLLVQTSATDASKVSMALKERSAAKKRATGAFLQEIPGDHKVLAADSVVDCRQVLRYLADSPQPLPMWRRQRSQLVVQEANFEPDLKNPLVGRLLLNGYIRGRPLGAGQPLHIPTAGDFHIDHIQAAVQPVALHEHLRPARPEAMESVIDGIIARVDPQNREPLDRENQPDLLAGEQTWPTEEELAEAEAATAKQRRRRFPKGTADIQAAWILDDDEDNDHYDQGDDDDYMDGFRGHDDRANSAEMCIVPSHLGSGSLGGNGKDDIHELEDEDEDASMDYEEATKNAENENFIEAKARRAAEVEEIQFPDEVDTPANIPARQRFERYRGLKSFRTSPWDPKEELPQEYARVFAFENFKRAHRRANQAAAINNGDVGSTAPLGAYVCVHVENISSDVANRVLNRVQAYMSGVATALAVWGLLQHECKLSVLNFSVRKVPAYEEPVVNKEELLFVTGLRSFHARPIYSTDEHGADKHKMERFLLEGRATVATIYGPICYPPLPLLAFKQRSDKSLALAATGSLRDCNPDRVILKKIVLSGYPVRQHKSKAVVRWMFFNPEDVKWFKPVELWTKQGRRGRIREPVGTHGAMKCIFDGPISQQDAVCMSLYKRVYPKWPENLNYA